MLTIQRSIPEFDEKQKASTEPCGIQIPNELDRMRVLTLRTGRAEATFSPAGGWQILNLPELNLLNTLDEHLSYALPSGHVEGLVAQIE